jgi:hypothetical protein
MGFKEFGDCQGREANLAITKLLDLATAFGVILNTSPTKFMCLTDRQQPRNPVILRFAYDAGRHRRMK